MSVVYLEHIQEQTSMVLLDFNWYPLTDSKRAVYEVRRTCYSCVNRDWVLFAAVCFGCFRCIRWDFSCWEFANIFVWFTHSRVHLPHPRPTRWERVVIIGHCAKQASDARAGVGCVRGVGSANPIDFTARTCRKPFQGFRFLCWGSLTMKLWLRERAPFTVQTFRLPNLYENLLAIKPQ